MKRKRYLRYSYCVTLLTIISLLTFSGCFGFLGSSEKKERIAILERKVDELGRQLQGVENYSRGIDKKVADASHEKAGIDSEYRMLKNNIASLETSQRKSDENFSKMKKAVISSQKAIKKMYQRMLNIEEQQNEVAGKVETITTANTAGQIAGSMEDIGSDMFGSEFDTYGNKKVVLNYREGNGSSAENAVVAQKLNKAKKLLDNGMIDEAIDLYEVILIANPNQLDAYYDLGSLYYDQGMIDKSIEIYKRVVELNPADAEAHSLLGVSYAKNDMIDNAITELRKALSINPNLAEVHVGLSVAYLKKGMTDESIKENKRAIAIDPNLAKAHKYLGIAYKRKGMKKEAEKEFGIYKRLSN